jgi:hypothetical protein
MHWISTTYVAADRSQLTRSGVEHAHSTVQQCPTFRAGPAQLLWRMIIRRFAHEGGPGARSLPEPSHEVLAHIRIILLLFLLFYLIL